MNYKLYHGKSPIEENIICDNIIDREDLNIKIAEYLKKINFKSYYYRMWIKDDYTYIDYGSHSDFFILDAKILDKPEVQKYKEGQVVELDNGQLMFYFYCQEQKIKEKIKSTL